MAEREEMSPDRRVALFMERVSRSTRNTTIDTERAQSLSYYQGEPFGNEQEGRSSVVMRDVFEVVEWIKPSLLRIFTSGEEVVKFQPQNADDVPKAQQETDYVNHVILERNSGFLTIYEWFTDALLLMNGYVVAYWDESSHVTEEIYEGQTQDQVAMLLSDSGVEVLEQDKRTLQTIIGPLEIHDLKIRRVVKDGQLRIRCIPPERVLVDHSHNSVCLQTADFVGYWEEMTISELRDMLPDADIPDDLGESESAATLRSDIVGTARNPVDPLNKRSDNDPSGSDPAMRVIKVYFGWMRVDADGDGIAERRRMIVAGEEPLYDEVDDLVSMAAITPTIMPHRHTGIDVVQVVKDLQLIKSTLMRGLLDNMYQANNGRFAIDEDRVNIDDMLVSRPNGIVRVTGEPTMAIHPLIAPSMSGNVLQAIEYLDGVKEERTGVSRLNQGLDANTLNKTMGGQAALQAAAQMRIELIARVFAETGFKDLCGIVHALLRMHQRIDQIVQLRGEWVTVNPSDWYARNDMRVTVGLGTGDSTNRLQHMQMIVTAQQNMLNMGLASRDTLYNGLVEFTKAAGFKDASKFWIKPDPNAPPPQQPPNPQVQAKMMELQVQMKRIETDMQNADADRRVKMEQHLQSLQGEYDRAFMEAQSKLASAALSQSVDRGAIKQQVADQMGIQTDDQAAIHAQTTHAQSIAQLAQMVDTLSQQVAQLSRPKPKSVRHVYDGAGRIVQSVADEQPGMAQ